MKTLIIYYSLNGNTKKIAEMLQQETDATLEEIKTIESYIGDYETIVEQGHKEVKNGFMPEIQELSVDLSEYDIIILGTPVWWYTFAPAVKTFLNQYDLSGKHIYPFATNGGWIGHTFKDIAEECKNSRMHTGLDIKFKEKKLCSSEAEIRRWVSSM